MALRGPIGAAPARPSNLNHRGPATITKLCLEFFRKRFAGGNVFDDGERGRSAAGHERGERAVGAEKLLKQGEHRIFYEDRRLERVVKSVRDVGPTVGFKI